MWRRLAQYAEERILFPKMLIARTYQPEYQHEGIQIVDAAEWLSNPIPKKSNFSFLGNGARFGGLKKLRGKILRNHSITPIARRRTRAFRRNWRYRKKRP